MKKEIMKTTGVTQYVKKYYPLSFRKLYKHCKNENEQIITLKRLEAFFEEAQIKLQFGDYLMAFEKLEAYLRRGG